MSHIHEVDAAERARAAAGGGVYHLGAPTGGNGYCIAGQEPVFARPTPLQDLNARPRIITREDREEAFGQVRDDIAAELVEKDLEGECNALFDVHDSSAAKGVVRRPMAELLRDLDATHIDDWLRLMAVCPVANHDIAALNFQEWLQRTMQQSRGIQEEAERRAVRRLRL